jgi:hypothetical protein
MPPRLSSRSDDQKAAEEAALKNLHTRLGVEFEATRLHLGGQVFDVDGYAEAGDRIMLAEVWAHVGKAKSAQRHKVKADILKLALITRLLQRERPACRVESYLVFIDAIAAQVVLNQSWAALAASEFGVQPLVVTVDPALIAAVRLAQQRQDLRADLPVTPEASVLAGPLNTDE